MSRILVIPHVLSHPVRIRGFELADALAARHDVTLLTGMLQGPALTKAGKLGFHARNLAGSRGRTRKGAQLRSLPSLAFRGALAREFNRRTTQVFLGRGRFDGVINASCGHEHELLPPRGCTYILDLVDDHVEGARLYEGASRSEEIRAFYARQLPRAQAVTVVSEHLRQQVQATWSRDAKVIPNGVSLEEFRAPDATLARALRQRLGLEGKFVFGYIGGVDEYVDVELVNQAFERLRARAPHAELLWVGPGRLAQRPSHELDALRRRGIRFLGPVPVEQSATYVSLFDVALIPKKVNSFTHAMMPIKSVEYGAARKPVIASPLSELERLQFPNVVLCPLAEAVWLEAMERAIASPRLWQSGWDTVFNRYSWDQVAQRFEELLDAHPARQ